MTSSNEPHVISGLGTSGTKVMKWIEKACYVPQGTLMGKQVRLSEFQKADIRRIYDNPAGTRRAILSFGRKNGKTSLAALLLLVHLVGPKKRPNSSLFSTAQSREQAAILFDYASMMVRMSPDPGVGDRDQGRQQAADLSGDRFDLSRAVGGSDHGVRLVALVLLSTMNWDWSRGRGSRCTRHWRRRPARSPIRCR